MSPTNFRRLVILLTVTAVCVGCGRFVARELRGVEAEPPEDFTYVGDMAPCYLELVPDTEALRVNCFELDGVLHIHSSRWAKLPRFSGESWIVTVQREPHVRVEIEEQIFELRAEHIADEARRKEILYDRGYWVAWDGIQVFRFLPREDRDH